MEVGDSIMATNFFGQQTAPTDPIYAMTASSGEDPHPHAREFIEGLYKETAEYLDPDVAERAPTSGLTPAFAEMYVAFALKRNGICLVPRGRRKPKRNGPDLLAEDPDVWIEVVAATSGRGADRLQTPVSGICYKVPTDPYVLRLRSVIEEKAGKLDTYIKREYIRDGQAAVIAICGALLEYRYSELPVPRIVRALYGVGDLVLSIDRTTTKVIGYSVAEHDAITKVCGELVQTNLFCHPGYAHVSAVLYTPSCWVCHPYLPGQEFIVVHNPYAHAQLPDKWLPTGDEYWLREGEVQKKSHRVAE